MSLLTVGLPVYNAMPFLPETIDSLLTQSQRDFEILIIDDGSTDGSADYLRALTDPRVRVIHQENRGLTRTLNRMLDEVQTPWLVRQDADDVAYRQRIERTLAWIERHPDAGMFYSLADYYPKSASIGTFRTTTAAPGVLRSVTSAGYILAICHPTVCLNVEKTKAVGGYRFDLHVEDIDLWWRMALAHDLRLIPEVLLGFRHNSGSVCQTNLERQALNTLYVQYLLISELWGRTPLPYDQAIPALELFLDRRHLKFRENMRMTNIAIAQRKWLTAAGRATSAFLASPGCFLGRVAYELKKKQLAVNGAEPLDFALHADRLWPSGNGPTQVAGEEHHVL